MRDTLSKGAQEPLIVQVTGYYPPHLGGLERVVQELSERLADRGHDVEVLTSNIGARNAMAGHRPNLRIKRFRALEFAHIPFAPGLVTEFFRLPRHTILHLHLSQAYYHEFVLLASRLRGIPYVLHFHLDLQPTGILGKLFVLYKATLLRLVIRQANQVVVFSEEQKRFIHKTYDVPRRKITIIPNGVGEEYFLEPRKTAIRKNYQLLYVGRLSPQKRVNILIEALPYLKTDVTLTLVGEGESRPELEDLVKRLRLNNVRFEGYQDHVKIIDYCKEADVFVISSENEGMSLSVLEMMAAGLPVVAANVPGLGDLLNNVGRLVDEPSGQAFAIVLNSLLTNPEARAKLGQASRTAAKAYSWEKVTDAVELLYKGV